MPIVGNHSGENIAKILIETIDEYGIQGKVLSYSLHSVSLLYNCTIMQVGWFTADNATNNDTAIRAVAEHIDPSGKNWDPVQHQVWYAFIIF